MKHNITRRKALATLASTALVLPGLTLAQADRPVKFILPNATGSGVDAITRAAAPALGKALGANVVVENKPVPVASSDCRPWPRTRPMVTPYRWCPTTW